MASPSRSRLPCPFCGHKISRLKREARYTTPPDQYAYYLVCSGCACQGPWMKSAGAAERMWNMRPPTEQS